MPSAVPLTTNTRLGPYEIVGPLGAGGMGEVYLARDTRLGREVAIKVLPAELSNDPDRLQRFEREAKAVSALNHPHIVTLYEVGESPAGPFLVLEKIDGQSLRDLMRDGVLSVKRLLAIGAQVAEGLAKAHAAGIVHRDLKPENIMVSADGFAKILDFGLAKLVYPELDADAIADATTLAAKTGTAMILGTLGYLSPEQAAGKPADFRSDQFALGVILYELATGEPPFKRQTTAESLAAVIREELAPLRTRSPAVPAQLSWIVERCLAKHPNDRYASSKDLARDLADLRDHLSEISLSGPRGHLDTRPQSSTWVRQGVLAMGVLAIAAGLGWFARGAAPTTTAPLSIDIERLTALPGVESEPTIAPDGKSVAYVRNGDLYLQRVGGRNPILLTPNSPARDFAPAFSPDGKRLAFNSDRDGGGIYVMGETGENVRRVTTRGFRPAWTPDGRELVFAASSADVGYDGNLGQRLEAVEIQSEKIRTIFDGSAQSPAVSPNGRHVAFWGLETGGTAQRDLWTVPLAGLQPGQTPTRLTNDAAHDWSPEWSPDGRWLYFVSERSGSPNLWRIPMDEASGRSRGAPQPVTLSSSYVARVRGSSDGKTFVFSSRSLSTQLMRATFDPRSERVPDRLEEILRLADWSWVGSRPFSPDGQWMVIGNGPSSDYLVVVRIDGSVVRKLAEGPYRNRAPAWSPDGNTIGFASDREGKYEIWGASPDGSNLRRLLRSPQPVLAPVWSPDGQQVLAMEMIQIGTIFRVILHRMTDPDDRFDRLPDLPDGDLLCSGFWRSIDEIAGEGCNGSIWIWSNRDRRYRKWVEGTMLAGSSLQGILPDGRLLLSGVANQGRRLESFDPESGKRQLLISDPEAFAFMLSPDQRALWINRGKEETDLWLARLRTP